MKRYIIVNLFVGLIIITSQLFAMENNQEKYTSSSLRTEILKITEFLLCNAPDQPEEIKLNLEKKYKQLIDLLQVTKGDSIIETISLQAKDDVNIEEIDLLGLTKKRVKDYCHGVIDDISDTEDETSYLKRDNFFAYQSIVARLYQIHYQLNPENDVIISVNKKELTKANKLLRIKASRYKERMETQQTVLLAKRKKSNDFIQLLIKQQKVYEFNKISCKEASKELQNIQSSLPKDKEPDFTSLNKLRKLRENINRFEKKCELQKDDEEETNRALKEAHEEFHRIRTSLEYLENDLKTVAKTPQDIVKITPSQNYN